MTSHYFSLQTQANSSVAAGPAALSHRKQPKPCRARTVDPIISNGPFTPTNAASSFERTTTSHNHPTGGLSGPTELPKLRTSAAEALIQEGKARHCQRREKHEHSTTAIAGSLPKRPVEGRLDLNLVNMKLDAFILNRRVSVVTPEEKRQHRVSIPQYHHYHHHHDDPPSTFRKHKFQHQAHKHGFMSMHVHSQRSSSPFPFSTSANMPLARSPSSPWCLLNQTHICAPNLCPSRSPSAASLRPIMTRSSNDRPDWSESDEIPSGGMSLVEGVGAGMKVLLKKSESFLGLRRGSVEKIDATEVAKDSTEAPPPATPNSRNERRRKSLPTVSERSIMMQPNDSAVSQQLAGKHWMCGCIMR
ncbi:hypothetical protein BDZ91DRAFT_788507 [Kalaharituber pfeilii]|nr:hypothetical protein BDZ91DRAFT_788507 [Kalaharituber pfeilii]